MPNTPRVIYQMHMPIPSDVEKMIGGLMDIGHVIAADSDLGKNYTALDLIKDKWDLLTVAERDRTTSAIYNTFDIGPSLQITDVKQVGKYTFRIIGEVR